MKKQVSFSASDSIKDKLRYDLEARSIVVTLQELHTYNGFFTFNVYMAHLSHSRKYIRFSVAGDTHQNAVAEIAIKNILHGVYNVDTCGHAKS